MSSDKSSSASSNVRHSSRIAAMSSQKRPAESPTTPTFSKLRKLDVGSEISPTLLTTRKKLLEKTLSRLKSKCGKHHDHIAEEFFLRQRGNLLEYAAWRKAATPEFLAHLKANAFDISDISIDVKSPTVPTLNPPQADANVLPSVSNVQQFVVPKLENQTTDMSPPVVVASIARGKPKSLFSGAFNLSSVSASTSVESPISQTASSLVRPSLDETRGVASAISSRSMSNVSLGSVESVPESIQSTSLQFTPKTQTASKPLVKPVPPTLPPLTIPAVYDIEKAAKQEANVLRRISELRRQGLWSAKKMPKCLDPPRNKTHWDYLLEEVQWMAIDFEQERKWKKSAAKKLSHAIARQKRELEDRGRKQEIEREKDLKRIAAYAAREVRQFWSNVEKVVEYKSESILDAKKKRALDLHLDFIVGQTEKFSSLVQEGLNKVSSSRSITPSVQADSEFEASESSDDDESTIAKAERGVKSEDVSDEIALLQKESEMEIDDILDALPTGYIEQYGRDSVSMSDMQSTSTKNKSDAESEDSDSNFSSCCHDKMDDSKSAGSSSSSEERQLELTHIAEAAEKFLPKGFTLDAVNTVTKQPFLLKHELREYQRVGLDWLVTLYDKNLNGILADEMGLGKTIQTIALLAYLACEKQSWGPHLIVVPTTVILNWEMEFKKWCPAFKILTYYGSLKERKEKRKGWSKPNSFHICITSYKLVMQDNVVFRRKNWEYLVLDEAQNIKNFKSQRWQTLLHFKTERRLLLTGTPLQNSLMELWSLMHFLMPHIFGSHKDFRDWFSNPLTGMIEGTQEFNEQTVKRLHKVLRPFLLRRLKVDVEKQLPKKFEHLIMCQLSKRQRFLYEDFMSKGSTKDQLSSGNVMCVMNILMQLRKVCNHPFLFEPRPILSPLIIDSLKYKVSPFVLDLIRRDASKDVKIPDILLLERFGRRCAMRAYDLSPSERLVEEIDFVEPQTPALKGFTFATMAKPVPASPLLHLPSLVETSSKRLEFVIPTSVAQTMNFNEPFFIQVRVGDSFKHVPVMVNISPASLQKIGLYPVSIVGQSSILNSPTVLRLCNQTSKNNNSLQAVPVSNGSSFIRSATSPVRTVHSVGVSRAGITVSTVPSPGKILIGLTGGQRIIIPSTVGHVQQGATTGVIRARTFNQGNLPSFMSVSRSATPVPTPGTPSLVARPMISVQDVTPKASPVVCFFEPNKLTRNPITTPKSPVTQSVLPSSRSYISSIPVSKISEPEISSSIVRPSTATTFVSQTRVSSDPHVSATENVLTATERLAVLPRVSKRPATDAAAFELGSLKRRTLERRVASRTCLLNVSRQRCSELPIYGSDLRQRLSVFRPNSLENDLITTFENRLTEMKPILDRFSFAIPPVKTCSSSYVDMAGPSCSALTEDSALLHEAYCIISKVLSPLTSVSVSQSIQFPELRLIEYDCGKLQSLSALLRKLKANDSRCLIFTQMTRMLDILESFLCYHGYTYLRLDGATRIEQRQILMERFNQDTKIFCFILSTRSGGIGVNLTGANAVIFYDSDWNPTMDAQAQDRCHRIGQTRDVHIYRLISEKTVEENILKKATQKRKLGEMAIEEGSFTADFFRKSNIRDIFELVDVDVARLPETSINQQELEQAMAKVEDERDVVAAKVARAEAVAELAEFDESQTNVDAEEAADPDVIKIEQEMKHLMDELKPVERYAVKYLETLSEPDRLSELRETEKEIEEHKRKWEQAHQASLQEEKRQQKEMEDEEFSLTFQADESVSQMYCSDGLSDPMPIWMPPTPPLSDNEFDAYYEPCMGFLYERDTMSDADLPPIYSLHEISIKSPVHADPILTHVVAPCTPSSSDLTLPAIDVPPAVAETIANIRSSVVQKSAAREIQSPRSLFSTSLTPKLKQAPRRPSTPPVGSGDGENADVFHDWTIAEDFSLLTAITKGQQMAYSLVSAHNGHGVNWDYISEWVTCACGRYRSPKQCHKRYENVIMPREEGRPILPELMNKKRKGGAGAIPNQDFAGLANTKKYRMRTSSQFQIEGPSALINHVLLRFQCMRSVTSKKHRTLFEASYPEHSGFNLYGVPVSGRLGDKHSGVLSNYGITYSTPLNPPKLVETYEEKQRAKDLEAKKQQQYQQQQQQQQQHTIEHSSLHQQKLLTPNASVAQTMFGATSPQQTVSQNQISFYVSSPTSNRMMSTKPTLSVQQPSAIVNSVVTVNSSPQRSSSGANLPGLITRAPTVLSPGNMTTATVYRHVGSQSFKLQRTPPGTPVPLTAYQMGGNTRTVVTVPGTGTTDVNSIVVQATSQQPIVQQPPSDFTALIKQPQNVATATSFRFPPPPVTSRKVQLTPQYGGSGGFLVSAEVSKSSSVVGSSHPITTILPTGQGRYGNVSSPVRTQVHLTAQAGSAQFKKANPHVARVTALPTGVRGALQLISTPQTSRLSGGQTIRAQQGVAQQLIRAGNAQQRTAIPSVNNILQSPVGRIETVAMNAPTTIYVQQPIQGVPVLQQQQQQPQSQQQQQAQQLFPATTTQQQ